jgi:hypothetical protein
MSLCKKLITEPGSAALPGGCVRGDKERKIISILLSLNQVWIKSAACRAAALPPLHIRLQPTS